MKKLLVIALSLSMLTGCGAPSGESFKPKEKMEPMQSIREETATDIDRSVPDTYEYTICRNGRLILVLRAKTTGSVATEVIGSCAE